MKNSLKTNLISKLKLINVLLIIFGFNLIDIELKAHLRGSYSTESKAKEKEKNCTNYYPKWSFFHCTLSWC